MSKTPSLPDIPTELKDAIFTYLPTRDVLNLISTCRSLRVTSPSTLYRRVSVDWSSTQSELVNTVLKSMSQNPTCFQYIKQVKLGATSEEKPALRPNEDAVLEGLNAQWNTAGSNQEAGSPSSPGGPVAAKILPLSLWQCTQLESLQVDIELLKWHRRWYGEDLLGDLVNPKILSRFQHLKHFAITTEGVPEGPPYWGEAKRPFIIHAEYFHHLFLSALNLPSIRDITIPWVPSPSSEKWQFRAGHPLPNLHTLHLHQTSLPPTSLSNLLPQTPHLVTLTYDFRPSFSETSIPLSTLQSSLSILKSTLRHLSLRIQPSKDSPANARNAVQGSLSTTLSSFPHLSHLNISLMTLYGDTNPSETAPLDMVLPHSLHSLTINDDLWENPLAHEWFPDAFFTQIGDFLTESEEGGRRRLEDVTVDMGTNGYVLTHEGEYVDEGMGDEDFEMIEKGWEKMTSARVEVVWVEV